MARLLCGTCFSHSFALMHVGLHALEHGLFVVQQLVPLDLVLAKSHLQGTHCTVFTHSATAV